MKKYVLYHPFSGKYVSNLSYDRRREGYNFQLTHNVMRLKFETLSLVLKLRHNAYLLGIGMLP